MTPIGPQDWTVGPAKWAAILVLGSASIFGMAWSITSRRPIAAVVSPAPPPIVQPPAQPGRVILREDVGPAVPAGDPAPPGAAQTARLNINTASAAELELLPGIGPALAARIIEDRLAAGPFKSVDDLDRVKGIGPKTLERVRDLCTVD
jgi:competence ComEA-like helix-hairpin-helix protein